LSRGLLRFESAVRAETPLIGIESRTIIIIPNAIWRAVTVNFGLNTVPPDFLATGFELVQQAFEASQQIDYNELRVFAGIFAKSYKQFCKPGLYQSTIPG
jgi:hypothetical protein